jgi:very-short-patch-repair endonuclease
VDRKIKIDDDILLNVYKFLRKHPNRHTLKEIKNMYNLNQSSLVLYKRLVDVFDKEEIDKHLKLGISSKPEIEFFNILRFYYGEDIQKNFVLNRKQYDYILLNKILIEYDGDYWHSMPNKIMVDKEKDILAKKNGYIIIRVKDSESKNVEVLHKINKIYLKVKKNEINV